MAKHSVWHIVKSKKSLAGSTRPTPGDADPACFRRAHDGAVIFLGIRYTSASLRYSDGISFSKIIVDPLDLNQISARWSFGWITLNAEVKTLKFKQPCTLKHQLTRSRTKKLLSDTGRTLTNAGAYKVQIPPALPNA